VRHCFVREEGDRLIFCQGVPARWLKDEALVSFGPAPTTFGTLTLELIPNGKHVRVAWDARWHAESPPGIEVRLPGYTPLLVQPGQTSVELYKENR
jgi:hypothetical protein